jgi:hypothetical protein
VVAYEQTPSQIASEHQADALSLAATNERERAQAQNLAALLPLVAGPLLVWCGNAHHAKLPVPGWTPMGFHFRELTNLEPFAIDQTASVRFAPDHAPRIDVTAALGNLLDRKFAGTAGYLSSDPPCGLEGWADLFDAVVVSTDNLMTPG